MDSLFRRRGELRRRRLARRQGGVLRFEMLQARRTLSGLPANLSAAAGLEAGFGSVSPGWFATVAAFSGFAWTSATIVANDALGTSDPPGAAGPSLRRDVPAGGVPWIVRLAGSAVADVRTFAGPAEFLEGAMPA